MKEPADYNPNLKKQEQIAQPQLIPIDEAPYDLILELRDKFGVSISRNQWKKGTLGDWFFRYNWSDNWKFSDEIGAFHYFTLWPLPAEQLIHETQDLEDALAKLCYDVKEIRRLTESIRAKRKALSEARDK